jgi:2-polyprenyl-3-methyl-5-hydroxy-6-metoxy-1,4-benzoquinol methylase
VTDGFREPVNQERRRPVVWVFNQVDKRFPRITQSASRYLIRFNYLLVNRSMRKLPRVCINYGWATLEGDGIAPDSALPPTDREGLDRLSLQHYEQTCAGHVAGKDVLEVGCGRGGGAELTKRVLGARSVTAVDLTASSIKWCKRRWANSGVRFQVGNAQDLPLGDSCFDVVLNVESSHTYPDCQQFLDEAFRVLRPQGLLLLADLRIGYKMPILRNQILAAGFVIEEDHDITEHVTRPWKLIPRPVGNGSTHPCHGCCARRRTNLRASRAPAFSRASRATNGNTTASWPASRNRDNTDMQQGPSGNPS